MDRIYKYFLPRKQEWENKLLPNWSRNMIFRKSRFTERDIQMAKMYKETLKFTRNRDMQIKISILSWLVLLSA